MKHTLRSARLGDEGHPCCAPHVGDAPGVYRPM
jgi:hypothetical protein